MLSEIVSFFKYKTIGHVPCWEHVESEGYARSIPGFGSRLVIRLLVVRRLRSVRKALFSACARYISLHPMDCEQVSRLLSVVRGSGLPGVFGVSMDSGAGG